MEAQHIQEERYIPTRLQYAVDGPLRSEQRVNALLPRVLSRVDMLTLFIVIVIFIPNTSIVQAAGGADSAIYFYWIIGTITFLFPGAIVARQLNRFMPADGSIYVWTHRALGPLWGFFAGFCAWFPGVLVLLAAGDSIITLLQGMCVQLWGSEPKWLMAPWQQGIVVLCVLLFAGWFSTFPLPFIMKLAKGVVALYGAAIFLVGLAGAIWLLRGHAAQVSFTINTGRFGERTFVLYGVIILALLGVEVPLNMAAEMKQPHAARLFLRWGPLIVLVAYVLGTFGVMTVVPQNIAGTPYSALTALSMVFGAPIAALVDVIFVAFFIMVAILYNIAFARILFVSALDYRLPTILARVNRYAAPFRAMNVQIIIVLIIVLFTYFIGPLLYQQEGTAFSSRVYNVSQATTAVIWCISMVILFFDLPILLRRFRGLLITSSEQLIAPLWVLYLCCGVGAIASMLGIWTTLRSSWDSALIPDNQWRITVGISALISLVIGLLGSAYPHLLSNLEEQTEIARENTRLYDELRVAYTRLSELDQLKDAFLITAAHELRTPLTIIQGYLELLQTMGDANPDVRRTFLAKACSACDELVVLLANVMDANRLTFDAQTLHITSVPLKNIVIAVVDLFESLAMENQHSITVDLDARMIVRADETRLKQIFHNLISNALRYSPPQTPIHIAAKVEKEGNMALICVKDHGLGIPLDKQEAIFDKFVRLERDMHGEIRGSGLGLFITRQLVEAMNGTIRVESSGVKNEGSTFSFTLPLDRSVCI